MSDNLNDLQRVFTDALNREAADGWEYCGRCAHSGNRDFWVDFVVLRRPIR